MMRRFLSLLANWLLPALLVGWMTAEAITFVQNPFNAPASQLPLRLFGLQIFKGSDATMAPAVAEGKYMVASAWRYLRQSPAAGDVVVMHYPLGSDQYALRRVVAAGPATVEIRDGALLVDGKPQPEPWLQGHEPAAYRSQVLRPRTLPADCYFVLGDNRDMSRDSREWGCVPRAAIVARKW
jgi:signal peptidase I